MSTEQNRPSVGDTAGAPHTDPQTLIRSLKGEIARQENLVYGFALFFECVSFLYAGQEAVILTYQKQLRNIILASRQAIEHASSLLGQAEKDPHKAPLLHHVRFSPGQGHPEQEELCRRALILAETYSECFPARRRSDPFTEHEIVRLINAASDRMGDMRLP